MKYVFPIEAADAGRRLDRYLTRALGDVPSSLVQRLLRTGKVRVDGERQPGSHELESGQEIVVHHTPRKGPIRAKKKIVAWSGPPLDRLYEDQHFLFLNKPPEVSCSEDGDSANIPAWLREYLPAGGPGFRPEPAHRLDRGTSGVVAIAKTAAAASAFHECSQAGEMDKCYQLLCWGGPRARRRVETALRRRDNPAKQEPRMEACAEDAPGALDATTAFRPLGRDAGLQLLEARLLSGRTHQIRAHCHSEGWPLVGDSRYGDRDRDTQGGLRPGRPLLHAAGIFFRCFGVSYAVVAPWPETDFLLLSKLGLQPPTAEGRTDD